MKRLAGLLGAGFLISWNVYSQELGMDETAYMDKIITYMFNPKTGEMEYSLMISSTEPVSSVTLYIPFVHYKKKLDKKVFGWLKEYISREIDKDKGQAEVRIGLLNTLYGEMLSLFIPKLLEDIRIGIGDESLSGPYSSYVGSDREIEVDRRKTIQNYKLTYEDKVEKREKKKMEMGLLKETFDLPFYVHFEGGGTITIKTEFHISVDLLNKMEILYYSIPLLEIDSSKSGWHWLSINKKTQDLKEIEKEFKRHWQ